MDVLISLPLSALLGAMARMPGELTGAGGDEVPPLALREDSLEAFLHDLARDRLLLPGAQPELGNEMRFPPPPRDKAFRRHVLLAAGIVQDPEVAPAVRMALATGGPKAPHLFRRLAQVAEAMTPLVDPKAVLGDERRAEELARRVAATFRISIGGEGERTSIERLSAVDAKVEKERAREASLAQRADLVRQAITRAAAGPAPLLILPE